MANRKTRTVDQRPLPLRQRLKVYLELASEFDEAARAAGLVPFQWTRRNDFDHQHAHIGADHVGIGVCLRLSVRVSAAVFTFWPEYYAFFDDAREDDRTLLRIVTYGHLLDYARVPGRGGFTLYDDKQLVRREFPEHRERSARPDWDQMIQAIRNDFGGFARDYSNLPAIMQLYTDTDLSMRVLNTKFPSAWEREMVYPELGRRADAMGLGDLADRLQARLYSSLAELMRTARDDAASQGAEPQ